MAAFTGEWVFELRVEGAKRRYLGPDVVGTGTEWAPGAMTGRGVWPRFGCGFASWSMLVQPDRQVTGGWFDVAGRPVAAIVGVGVSEAHGDFPRLDLTALAPEPAPEPELAAVSHRVGPLLVLDGWRGAACHVRRLLVRDAASATIASLTIVEEDDTRRGTFVVAVDPEPG